MRIIKGKNLIVIMSTTAALLTGCSQSVDASQIRRDYLAEQGIDGRIESLEPYVEDVKDSASGAYADAKEGAKDKASQVGDKARDLTEAAKDKATDLKDKAGKQASSTYDKTSDAVSEAADKAVDAAKDVANRQAQDTKQDADYFIGNIKNEWYGILHTLTSPWGLNKTVDDLLDNGSSDATTMEDPGSFDPSIIGEYSGQTCVTVNGNVPFFSEDDLTTTPFEHYSPLDSKGRCGTAYANICQDIMPTSERGDIGMVKPTGWNQNKYEGIIDEDPPYLYNRCHLIAYSLAGENANPKNLITGTRHFNVETGMEQYELKVLSYVRSTGNHVLYRVTPYFKGDNLLANGVLMEARSVEDEGLIFCVFVYNVQPGIVIDYTTGENHAA